MITYYPVQRQPIRLKQVLRLSRVLPPSCNLRIPDLVSITYKIIVCIRDLKLSPRTWLNIVHCLKDSGVINIDAGYCILTLGIRWFFFNTYDPPILHFRYTKTLRVMNL